MQLKDQYNLQIKHLIDQCSDFHIGSPSPNSKCISRFPRCYRCPTWGEEIEEWTLPYCQRPNGTIKCPFFFRCFANVPPSE